MAVPEKYSHIDFKPPSGVRREAEYGLKLRREYGRGGTAVGIARARDLSNGAQVSPSTVRRMKAYFDRHATDQNADGFNRGDKSWPSNGYIAAKLWGGFESGYSWAKKVVEQMNAADDKNESRSLRPKGSELGVTPKVVVVYGPPGSGKRTYVASNRGDNDVTFDFDSIMQSLSGKPAYSKNENLISYCLDIRTLILNKALRSPKVDTTWIVVTNADESLRTSLGDVPVKYVEMDTPKEECLRRVSEDPLRKDSLDESKEVIDRYFASQRSVAVQPNVERRYLGTFSSTERPDPTLLGVERRADPQTGKTRTYISGYAAKFGKDSLLLGDFVERIAPGAFEIVEKREDLDGKPLETRCLFNHSPDHLLGRFPNTLRMWVDEVGLKYECLLPESREDIAELISRGDLLGSSFSFVVADGGEQWTTENGRSLRLVTKIKTLVDVSPVTYPAYDSATVAVAKRSYQHNVVEVRKKHSEDKAERRQVLSRAAVVKQEMQEFLADRRGADCGRDDGGRFGSGNKCQDGDGDGGSKMDAIAKKYGVGGGTSSGDGKMDAIAKKHGVGGGFASGGKDLPASAGKKTSAGKYKEWKKGDHLDKSKESDAQSFLDKALESQLKRGGKDGGKSDDGGGVQTWSKGDHFPWTSKQVGKDEGYVQASHPDGSKTKQYTFTGGKTSDAYAKLSEELKKWTKKRSADVVSETLAFLKDRR
jgi:HK97 family phage prohead protease